MVDKIRQLIKDGKLEKAIEELISYVSGRDDLSIPLIEFQATLTENRNDSRRGLISGEEEHRTRRKVRYAVLEMLKEIEEVVGPGAASVFISYSHGDSEIADKIKQSLEKKGIVVRIDHAVMKAGANIQEFIESSIRNTDVTLSIVSNRSLLSAWVALESIETFYHEKFDSNKKFIACYVDDDFFRNDFLISATEQIDAKIDEINKLIQESNAQRIDSKDLNNQKSRLYKLRNNLGDILLRLKESLCLDIRGNKLDESVTKIVSAITS